MERRDYIPVAPSWERNPEDSDLWRRVVVMPSLALNQAEMEFLGAVAGKRVAVLGSGEGIVPLALAAMGAKVTVIDPTNSGLDVVLVRAQIVGVELEFREAEFEKLSSLGEGWCELAYAAQVTGGIEKLGSFYGEVYRILTPGGRLIINEYHPFRRIWKQEPGHPRVARSYFERQKPLDPDSEEELGHPGAPADRAVGLVSRRFEFRWTISDHFYFLNQAGFRVAGIEEVGDARQHWEMPNLTGLPEQLIVAADKPQSD
ncbi:MAG: class I SAM-dependent methyltransferase [candidate division WOR-3 bacterium]